MEEIRPEIFDSLRSFCIAGLELYKARLEVALIELDEEKERVQHLLILGVVAAVLLLLGVAVLTTLGVLLLAAWIGLPGALAIFALLYLGSGGIICGLIYRQHKERHPLFRSTLKEFQKDSDCLCAFLQKPQKPSPAQRDADSTFT